MANRKLHPKSGCDYLSPSEVITRLQAGFKYVDLDPHQGQLRVDQMADQLTRMQFLTPPPATLEEIDRLRSLRKQAVFVTFYDNSDSEYCYLSTTVIPGEPLFIGFSSSQHEEHSAQLLARCAMLLDYDVFGG
jgi:hypothetical protein